MILHMIYPEALNMSYSLLGNILNELSQQLTLQFFAIFHFSIDNIIIISNAYKLFLNGVHVRCFPQANFSSNLHVDNFLRAEDSGNETKKETTSTTKPAIALPSHDYATLGFYWAHERNSTSHKNFFCFVAFYVLVGNYIIHLPIALLVNVT